MGKHLRMELTAPQRQHLENLIRAGAAPARVQTRARILLLCDRSQGQQGQHRTNEAIADALLCSRGTISNIRRRFLSEGLEAALFEKPRPGQAPKITGDVEAQLTVLACCDPPTGKARWTMRLLADKLVEMGTVESLSHVAVHQRLKKTHSSQGSPLWGRASKALVYRAALGQVCGQDGRRLGCICPPV